VRKETLAALKDWDTELAKHKRADDPQAITPQEYAAKADCSPATAQRKLKAMLEAGAVVDAWRRIEGRWVHAYRLVKK
jgi:DNA-binding transcriptional ArsR family regulator